MMGTRVKHEIAFLVQVKISEGRWVDVTASEQSTIMGARARLANLQKTISDSEVTMLRIIKRTVTEEHVL